MVYVPYGIKHQLQAKQMYQTLMLNCIELQQTGSTTIMGDLNTRSGDKQIDDKTNTMCVKQLNQLRQSQPKVGKKQNTDRQTRALDVRGPSRGTVSTRLHPILKRNHKSSKQRLSWEANCDSNHHYPNEGGPRTVILEARTTINECKQQLPPYQ